MDEATFRARCEKYGYRETAPLVYDVLGVEVVVSDLESLRSRLARLHQSRVQTERPTKPGYLPTPEEIAAACAAIRERNRAAMQRGESPPVSRPGSIRECRVISRYKRSSDE